MTNNTKPNYKKLATYTGIFSTLVVILTNCSAIISGIKDGADFCKDYIFSKSTEPKVELVKPTQPIFSEEDTTFKILILSFNSLGCNEKDGVGRTINEGLKKLNEKDTLNLNPKYPEISISADFPKDSIDILLNFHHADLIIYGDYTKAKCDDLSNIDINLNYRLKKSWLLDNLQSKSAQKNSYKSSIDELRQGKIKGNIDFIVYWCAGYSHYDKENYTKALKKFKMAESLEPNNYQTYYYLGKCYYQVDSNANAIKYLNKCVDIANEKKEEEKLLLPYLFLAYTYDNIDDPLAYNNALSYFFKYLDLAEKKPEGESDLGNKYYYLANIFYNKKDDHEKASFYYQKAIKNLPSNEANNETIFKAYFAIGYCYYKVGKYKSSIETLKKAQEIYPKLAVKNNYELYLVYARAAINYRFLKDYNNCFAYYKLCLQEIEKLSLKDHDIDSERTECLTSKGLAHYYFKEYEQSKQCLYTAHHYRKLSKDSTNLGDIYKNLSLVYTKLDNQEAAINYASKAKNAYVKEKAGNKDLGELQYVLGNIADNKKDYKQAISHYKQSLVYLEKDKYQKQFTAKVLHNLAHIAKHQI